MNLHALSFEQILRVCASLEDPREIEAMIRALEVLEKNIRYRRQELTGLLNGLQAKEREERRQQRKALKESLHVVRPNGKDEDTEEDAT